MSQTDERKKRLFACAACRGFQQFQVDPLFREAVRVAEKLADGEPFDHHCLVDDPQTGRGLRVDGRVADRFYLYGLLDEPFDPDLLYQRVSDEDFRNGLRGYESDVWDVEELQRLWDELLVLIATPVHFDPRWRTADTVGLARGIYEDRAFDRMPLLADALMDAGCADEQVLSHCKGPRSHVRGCWVVDLVLGKE